MSLFTSCRSLDVVQYWRDREGGLLLNPPYQRGDVWGPKRRVNLIRSILLGVPIPSIIINDRMAAEWKDDYQVAVIDGKQRITTILMFLDGNLPIPGEWVGDSRKEVSFTYLPVARRRIISHLPLSFSEGRLPTLDAEKEVFDLVNFGGLAQGETDNGE